MIPSAQGMASAVPARDAGVQELWGELVLQAAAVFCAWFLMCMGMLKAADAGSAALERASRRKGTSHQQPRVCPTRDRAPSAERKPTGRVAADPVVARSASAGPGADRPGAQATFRQKRERAGDNQIHRRATRSEGDLSSLDSRESLRGQRLQRRASGSFFVGEAGAAVDDADEGPGARRQRQQKLSSIMIPPQSPSGKLSSKTRSLARSWSADSAWTDFLTSSACWRIEEESNASEPEGTEEGAEPAMRKEAPPGERRGTGSRRCDDDWFEARWSNFAHSHYSLHYAARRDSSASESRSQRKEGPACARTLSYRSGVQ